MTENAPRAVYDELAPSRRRFCVHGFGVVLLDRSAARAGVSCSKAHRRAEDIDHGTSLRDLFQHRRLASATRSGLGPSAIGYVLGICKAYHHPRPLRPVPDRTAEGDSDRRRHRPARPASSAP